MAKHVFSVEPAADNLSHTRPTADHLSHVQSAGRIASLQLPLTQQNVGDEHIRPASAKVPSLLKRMMDACSSTNRKYVRADATCTCRNADENIYIFSYAPRLHITMRLGLGRHADLPVQSGTAWILAFCAGASHRIVLRARRGARERERAARVR